MLGSLWVDPINILSFKTASEGGGDVCCGSLADTAEAMRYVRDVPIADMPLPNYPAEIVLVARYPEGAFVD